MNRVIAASIIGLLPAETRWVALNPGAASDGFGRAKTYYSR